MVKIGVRYVYCCRVTEYRVYEIASELDDMIKESLMNYTLEDLDLNYDGNPFVSILEKNTCITSTRLTYDQCDYKLTHTMC